MSDHDVVVPAIIHLVGAHVTTSDRFGRQRCAWCGEVLIDFDIQRDGNIRFLDAGQWVQVFRGGLVPVKLDNAGKTPHNSCIEQEVAQLESKAKPN